MKINIKAVSVLCLVLCLICGVCTAEGAKLNDGVYEGYFAQPTYLIRATVTVANGAVAKVEYEECHDPNYWATFTADEAATLPTDEYIEVAGTRGATYYAKHAVVGVGDEAIYLTANGDGSAMPVYGNEEIADFVEWLKESPENDAWYYEQLAAGNYWVALSDGTKLEELAVYTNTLKDGHGAEQGAVPLQDAGSPLDGGRHRCWHRVWRAGLAGQHGCVGCGAGGKPVSPGGKNQECGQQGDYWGCSNWRDH